MSRPPAFARAVLAAVAALALALSVAPAPARAGEPLLEGLRKGLRSRDPEARARALRDAATSVRTLDDAGRRQAALVVRKALAEEPEAFVRVEAVGALARLADDVAWVPVLSAAASDRDAGVRKAAAAAFLVARGEAVAAAARLVAEDQDPTFRAEVCLLLGRRRRLDAVPALLAGLRDAHPRVATAAAEALQAATGEAFGWDPDAWTAWWERARAAAPSAADPRGERVTREEAPREPPAPPPPPRGLVPELYGVPLPSKDLVFVVDVSGSIGDAGLDRAKGEVVSAVERLGSDVRLAVVFFHEEARFWHAETVPATPAAKAEFARFVRGIPRGSRTDLMTALNGGLAIVRRRIEARAAAGEALPEPVALVVVSDGQENVRGTPGSVVGERLDRLDLRSAVVHAIVLGGRENALMAALARRGGGRCVVVGE